MDRLHAMGVFVAVAEAEGFAAAGRRLDMSPPAVTRTIAALEAHLGVTLLHRTTRTVRLTDAGRRYLTDAREVIAAARRADEAAAGLDAEPRGELKVTAPVLFGRLHVMPIVARYLARYPDTRASVLLLDRNVDLLEEGLDVAVRIGELPDSTQHARRLGQVRIVTVASPGYLAAAGTPRRPEDLKDHAIIRTSAIDPMVAWRFGDGSRRTTLRFTPRVSVNNNDAAIEAARLGLGVTRLLSYQAASAVAAGELKCLLKRFDSAPWPVHAVYREGANAAAKVRAFVELAAQMLADADL